MAQEALRSKKGEQIKVLDVSGISPVTDYYIIVTGNSTPHLKALAEEVEKELDRAGIRCYRRAGTPESGWIVEDYLDFVVHIFSPDMREYYQLERLWSDGKVIL